MSTSVGVSIETDLAELLGRATDLFELWQRDPQPDETTRVLHTLHECEQAVVALRSGVDRSGGQGCTNEWEVQVTEAYVRLLQVWQQNEGLFEEDPPSCKYEVADWSLRLKKRLQAMRRPFEPEFTQCVHRALMGTTRPCIPVSRLALEFRTATEALTAKA